MLFEKYGTRDEEEALTDVKWRQKGLEGKYARTNINATLVSLGKVRERKETGGKGRS